MTQSMTAYSRCQMMVEAGEIVWELRSLNSRYLELNIKLPDEWRLLEPEARELLSKNIKRGKVECFLRFRREALSQSRLQLNPILAKRVLELGASVGQLQPALRPLAASDLLRWPGVVIEEEIDVSALQTQLLSGLQQAIDELIKTREREGQKLAVIILERCAQIQELVKHIRIKAPTIRAAVEAKMRQRLADLDITVDPNRFEQELVFQLQKIDIQEEIDRLESHLSEVHEVFRRQDSVGRRLDFLMQELNREANTLGTKAATSDIKGVGVELKVLIEQMREQIQNLE